jgi:hypothetical protein
LRCMAGVNLLNKFKLNGGIDSWIFATNFHVDFETWSFSLGRALAFCHACVKLPRLHLASGLHEHEVTRSIESDPMFSGLALASFYLLLMMAPKISTWFFGV